MSASPEPDEQSLINARWQRTKDVLSVVGPPLTVVTALLVYFGWARTDAQAKAMGLDVSLFGYTVQDFILRSIQSLFQPLAWLVVIGLLWLMLDRAVSQLLEGGRHRGLIRRTATVVLVLGFAYAAVMWVVVVTQPERILLYAPFLIAAGLVVGAWGLSVRRRAVSPGDKPVRSRPRALETALVFVLVTLLLFWGTSDFAQALGRGAAVDYQERSGLLPTAVVYSKERLAVSAPNVHEESTGTEAAPLYRYTGLRLLVVSGGRIFLLNDGWSLAQGRVVVLPDNGTVRVEYGNPTAD
ncbi:hypothetical protein [Paenarthrobacter nitroguajacolicus]|uniref:hypothetical protein n=1 Tax=Paenarthrobacter nitroguajacolicus TaxID=211146 RepID=UPI001FCC703F|nr:hypothetical protein [Paenarthrobacter nitroguajacolicus]